MVVEYVAETSGLAKGVLQVAELATVAALAVTAASVKMAGDFEKGMTALQTGAGESAKNLQMVSDGIKQIAIDTGTSTKDLLSAMFMVDSSNIHGADSLKVLTIAAQ